MDKKGERFCANIAAGVNRSTTMSANLVTVQDLKSLMEFFAKQTYNASKPHPEFEPMMQRCLRLFGMDYEYTIIPNPGGELSLNYPSQLVCLESEKKLTDSSSSQSLSGSIHKSYSGELTNGTLNGTGNGNGNGNAAGDYFGSWNTLSARCYNRAPENTKLKDLCSKARLARCRARFPVSVILYNNKHICRSATISGGPELYGRSSMEYFFSGSGSEAKFDIENADLSEDSDGAQGDAWQLFNRVRSKDKRLLKAFRVEHIVDLMVEKKKVKFGMNVTSSEKVDKEKRYAGFNIICLPYPGCEFFKDYRDNDYCAERLVFEWNQGHVDADICIPTDPSASALNIKWSEYRNWDLVLLTQNYMKLLLTYLRDGESGLLIHCISGWDRTPLFISLLRLSLWADGAIHKSLDVDQILYLTLAYDWVLFGHNLADRLTKGEEILYFCFNFLKYICDAEFSVQEECETLAIIAPPVHSQLARVRNHSDSHLVEQGVLLEGDGTCHTSPEGSNWSINSCGSSQSSQSQDNPPTYFQVPHDSSWEDCRGTQHLLNLKNNSTAAVELLCSASPSNGNGNGNSSTPPAIVLMSESATLSNSCLITNSMINSTTTLLDEGPNHNQSPSAQYHFELPLVHKFGQSPNTQPSTTPLPISPLALELPSSGSIGENGTSPRNGHRSMGSLHGTTSPVAVPKRRHHHHHHHSDHPRLESDSSASIGSWQMINGSGSLREALSSSEPSSTSSHSSRCRISKNGPDCIEGSDSSCTLAEDLTPSECKSDFRFMSPECKSIEIEPQEGILETINGDNLKYEVELGLALDEGLNVNDETDADHNAGILPLCFTTKTPIPIPDPLTGGDPFSSLTSTPTEEATPTRESFKTLDLPPSKRRLRLESVRSRFCDIYQRSILHPPPRRPHENGGGSGGGLGYFIGNIASKVGIRTGSHRTTYS